MNLLERAQKAMEVRKQFDGMRASEARAVLGMVHGLIDDEIAEAGKDSYSQEGGKVKLEKE